MKILIFVVLSVTLSQCAILQNRIKNSEKNLINEKQEVGEDAVATTEMVNVRKTILKDDQKAPLFKRLFTIKRKRCPRRSDVLGHALDMKKSAEKPLNLSRRDLASALKQKRCETCQALYKCQAGESCERCKIFCDNTVPELEAPNREVPSDVVQLRNPIVEGEDQVAQEEQPHTSENNINPPKIENQANTNINPAKCEECLNSYLCKSLKICHSCSQFCNESANETKVLPNVQQTNNIITNNPAASKRRCQHCLNSIICKNFQICGQCSLMCKDFPELTSDQSEPTQPQQEDETNQVPNDQPHADENNNPSSQDETPNVDQPQDLAQPQLVEEQEPLQQREAELDQQFQNFDQPQWDQEEQPLGQSIRAETESEQGRIHPESIHGRFADIVAAPQPFTYYNLGSFNDGIIMHTLLQLFEFKPEMVDSFMILAKMREQPTNTLSLNVDDLGKKLEEALEEAKPKQDNTEAEQNILGNEQPQEENTPNFETRTTNAEPDPENPAVACSNEAIYQPPILPIQVADTPYHEPEGSYQDERSDERSNNPQVVNDVPHNIHEDTVSEVKPLENPQEDTINRKPGSLLQKLKQKHMERFNNDESSDGKLRTHRKKYKNKKNGNYKSAENDVSGPIDTNNASGENVALNNPQDNQTSKPEDQPEDRIRTHKKKYKHKNGNYKAAENDLSSPNDNTSGENVALNDPQENQFNGPEDQSEDRVRSHGKKHKNKKHKAAENDLSLPNDNTSGEKVALNEPQENQSVDPEDQSEDRVRSHGKKHKNKKHKAAENDLSLPNDNTSGENVALNEPQENQPNDQENQSEDRFRSHGKKHKNKKHKAAENDLSEPNDTDTSSEKIALSSPQENQFNDPHDPFPDRIRTHKKKHRKRPNTNYKSAQNPEDVAQSQDANNLQDVPNDPPPTNNDENVAPEGIPNVEPLQIENDQAPPPLSDSNIKPEGPPQVDTAPESIHALNENPPQEIPQNVEPQIPQNQLPMPQQPQPRPQQVEVLDNQQKLDSSGESSESLEKTLPPQPQEKVGVPKPDLGADVVNLVDQSMKLNDHVDLLQTPELIGEPNPDLKEDMVHNQTPIEQAQDPQGDQTVGAPRPDLASDIVHLVDQSMKVNQQRENGIGSSNEGEDAQTVGAPRPGLASDIIHLVDQSRKINQHRGEQTSSNEVNNEEDPQTVGAPRPDLASDIVHLVDQSMKLNQQRKKGKQATSDEDVEDSVEGDSNLASGIFDIVKTGKKIRKQQHDNILGDSFNPDKITKEVKKFPGFVSDKAKKFYNAIPGHDKVTGFLHDTHILGAQQGPARTSIPLGRFPLQSTHNVGPSGDRFLVGRTIDPPFQQANPSFQQPESSFQQPETSFHQPETSFHQPDTSFQQPSEARCEDDLLGAPVTEIALPQSEAFDNMGTIVPANGVILTDDEAVNNFGKIVPADQDVNNLMANNVFFMGNGIKLPLKMNKNSDGSVSLSVDLEKMCKCKNCSSSANSNEIDNERVETILEEILSPSSTPQSANLERSKRSADEILTELMTQHKIPKSKKYFEPSLKKPTGPKEIQNSIPKKLLPPKNGLTNNVKSPKKINLNEDNDDLENIRDYYQFKQLEVDLERKLEKLNEDVKSYGHLVDEQTKDMLDIDKANKNVEKRIGLVHNVLNWMKGLAITNEQLL